RAVHESARAGQRPLALLLARRASGGRMEAARGPSRRANQGTNGDLSRLSAQNRRSDPRLWDAPAGTGAGGQQGHPRMTDDDDPLASCPGPAHNTTSTAPSPRLEAGKGYSRKYSQRRRELVAICTVTSA